MQSEITWDLAQSAFWLVIHIVIVHRGWSESPLCDSRNVWRGKKISDDYGSKSC